MEFQKLEKWLFIWSNNSNSIQLKLFSLFIFSNGDLASKISASSFDRKRSTAAEFI